MCPLVSGITSRDAALSSELGMRALDLAVGRAVLAAHSENNVPVAADSDCRVLRPGGHLIVKLLESEYIKEFREICNPLFRKASWLRPKATRSCSREIYLICQGLQ
ncbi:uncharacterized protein LOC111377504 [Olea europaea var. sylvestris]|nr:uncharacterized protein LOC111377504 [Olea europaea var. sylvestris]